MNSANEERLLDQNETLTEAVSGIRVILARQEEHLAYHIKRTDLLEESVEMLRQEIKPIKLHVELINKMCKVFTIALTSTAAFVGIAAGLFKIAEFFL